MTGKPASGVIRLGRRVSFGEGCERLGRGVGLAAGFEFVSAYAASKFGLEGWMESLQAEIAPFGIATTIVNPGFFRTDFSLSNRQTMLSRPSPTTTSAEGHWSNTGKPRTDTSQGTRQSSRARSSRLRARNNRRAASSRATMPLPPLHKRSQTSKRRSRRTANSRRHSLSTELEAHSSALRLVITCCLK